MNAAMRFHSNAGTLPYTICDAGFFIIFCLLYSI